MVTLELKLILPYTVQSLIIFKKNINFKIGVCYQLAKWPPCFLHL